MTFGSKLKLNVFLNLKFMITRSCHHKDIFLFYFNRIEPSGPEFNSSCPILLFQNEMAHTAYLAERLHCIFSSDHSFICLDTVESDVLFDLLVCLCWGEGGMVGVGGVGVEGR